MRYINYSVFIIASVLLTTGTIYSVNGENLTKTKIGNIIPNSFIITLKEETNFQQYINGINITGINVTATYPELGMLVVDVPSQFINEIDKNQILNIEPNRIFGIEEKILKDNRSANFSSTQILPAGIDRIDAENASKSFESIVVAVIDSGIDLDHHDLNVIENVSFIPKSDNGDDDYGHGTHIAGTIAAIDNNIGVVGVAPNASLVAIKVLNSTGYGSTDQVLSGINYTISNSDKIDIVNISIQGDFNSTINNAIERLVDKGIPVVVISCNFNSNASSCSPASAAKAITTSAMYDDDGKCGGLGNFDFEYMQEDDSFAAYSGWGFVVDIMAPGSKVLSSIPNDQLGIGYGTSMAAPHVTGAIALIKSVDPKATPDEILEYLKLISNRAETNCNVNDENGKGYVLDRTFDEDEIKEPLLNIGDFLKSHIK